MSIWRRSPDAVSPVQVTRWQRADLLANLDTAMTIYADAMNYPRHTGQLHAAQTATHTHRTDFRCTAALASGKLVGFGYGYVSEPGQWWHEQVRSALGQHDVTRWLADSYELCELHVMPAWQGRGIGRALLRLLADGLPYQNLLLSTPEGDTRAWRLYHSVGFRDIARQFLFPGDGRPFAILGVALPLANSDA